MPTHPNHSVAAMVLPADGLIVKGHWLDLILSGEKCLEIRGQTTTKRGTVGLIKSGTGLVFGEVDIVNTFIIQRADFDLYFSGHMVDSSTLGELSYKVIHAWMLTKPVRYAEPISYKHPRGAITWVDLRPDAKTKQGCSTSSSRKRKRPSDKDAVFF